MNCESFEDINQAGLALIEWFKSQDIDPPNGMMMIAFIVARMIIENSESLDDQEDKLAFQDQTTREFITMIRSLDPQ
jgi:hypothetical protein